jgi:cation diffusion facilitator family transporter
MHTRDIEKQKHDHCFQIEQSSRNERRTWCVIALTVATMLVEIVGGKIYGSMALLADGWHMGTHAGALGITAFAYTYARRHAENPRFTFGTGKVTVLGGYTSAIVLALIALLMLWESGRRLVDPVSIRFNEALVVAFIGLCVNLASAFLLRGHDHNEHHDHNIRAAYLHVLADALTSVLAIAALLTGKAFGWIQMDPMMGIVGSLIIARWSYGLIKDTSKILLDREAHPERLAAIKRVVESESDNRVSDIHLWWVGPNQYAAVITVLTHHPRPPDHYRNLLGDFEELNHVTVEIKGYDGPSCIVEAS